MKEKAVVTGMGIITSNGTGIADFLKNCREGKRGITDQPCPSFDTKSLRTPFWGQVQNIPSPDGKEVLADRPGLLARIAVDEALQDAGMGKDEIRALGDRAVLTVGSLSFDDYHMMKTVQAMEAGEDERADLLAGLSDIAHQIKDYCGIAGACYNYSSACSSSAVAVGMGIELIRSGACDLVLVCGVDALSRTVAYGFHSLKALSRGICRPLDSERDGINIGEGCGVMVLESYSHAMQRNTKVYVECAGYSIGNEAFHMTSPDTSGNGFYRSMRDALKDAGIQADQIDYINLHGTGTPVNDKTELLALKMLYPSKEKMPYFSSVKTLIGHCMGAAGVIEAILTVLCLYHQYYFPILYVDHPMEEMAYFSYDPPADGTPMKYAMSNSFAFAGNTASLVFRRAESGGSKDDDMVCGTDDQKLAASGKQGISGNSSDSRMSSWKCAVADIPGGIWLNGLGVLASEKETETPAPGVPARSLRGAGRLSRMVLSSALQAAADAGCDHKVWKPEKKGAFFSTGYGAVSEGIKFGKTVAAGDPDRCSPIAFANISQNAPLGHLSIAMNCQGASGSLHGAAPLLPSVLALRTCDTVLSCVAEGHDPWLEKALNRPQTPKEQAVTLILQTHPSDASYGQITHYACISLSALESVSLPSESPELIILQDTLESVTEKERKWLKEAFPEAEVWSGHELQGEYLGTPFYVNIAMAARFLRDGTLPGEVGSEIEKRPERIMITGYDSCENYHVMILSLKGL